jgi:diacylglycerol kinase (ATP)
VKHERAGIARIMAAFRNSYDGFMAAVKSEEAFRQELLLMSAFLAAAFAIDFSMVERLFLLTAIFFVLFAELVNTAVEFTIDRIGTEQHRYSKIAKDIGSLIVLMSFAYFGAVWGIVLFNKFM